MKAIEARGLAQRYGRRLVFSGLDLDLEAGGSLAVLGANGAGKSTLLRLLATAARPAAGTLRILGNDASSQRGEIRRQVGYLGESLGLYPALTARENLEFFAALHGVGGPRCGELLERVGLAAAAGRRAGQLSRGMQQRLALARAVLHSPALLLLDEPESGLDAAGRELLAELVSGRALVIATHDRELAGRLCSSRLDFGARPPVAA